MAQSHVVDADLGIVGVFDNQRFFEQLFQSDVRFRGQRMRFVYACNPIIVCERLEFLVGIDLVFLLRVAVGDVKDAYHCFIAAIRKAAMKIRDVETVFRQRRDFHLRHFVGKRFYCCGEHRLMNGWAAKHDEVTCYAVAGVVATFQFVYLVQDTFCRVEHLNPFFGKVTSPACAREKGHAKLLLEVRDRFSQRLLRDEQAFACFAERLAF